MSAVLAAFSTLYELSYCVTFDNKKKFYESFPLGTWLSNMLCVNAAWDKTTSLGRAFGIGYYILQDITAVEKAYYWAKKRVSEKRSSLEGGTPWHFPNASYGNQATNLLQ